MNKISVSTNHIIISNIAKEWQLPVPWITTQSFAPTHNSLSGTGTLPLTTLPSHIQIDNTYDTIAHEVYILQCQLGSIVGGWKLQC